MKKIALLLCLLCCSGAFGQRDDIKTLLAKASKGDIDAQAYLAFCYEKGNNVPQSYPKAVLWYESAAKKGNAKAQTKLGLLTYKGLGTTQSYAKAAEWFERAANQGAC